VIDALEFEALLKHPRPMGRPFMHRWVTIQALELKAAKETAATEARLCGWRVWKVRRADSGSNQNG
jgi:hypothetical protein